MNIDFYISSAPSIQASYAIVARLVAKAFQQQHRVYIHFDEPRQVEQVDGLLWSYNDISFLPHDIYQDTQASTSPIQLGCGAQAPQHHDDILINLARDIPQWHQQFQRILEVVYNDEQAKNTLRQHYSYYKNNGYSVQSHHL